MREQTSRPISGILQLVIILGGLVVVYLVAGRQLLELIVWRSYSPRTDLLMTEKGFGKGRHIGFSLYGARIRFLATGPDFARVGCQVKGN